MGSRDVNIVELHKRLYDDLAEEYERRAAGLVAVTEDSINVFSSYIKPGGQVLDIGCGVGVAVNVLTQKGFKVSGLELSSKMVKFARKRNPGVKFIVEDFSKANFNEKFDAILTFAFIHLFPKSEIPVIFRKIKSILQPNGVVLISTTESFESKEGIYVKADFGAEFKRFRKFWTEPELRESLIRAGFKEIMLNKYIDPFGKKWLDFIVKII